MVLDHHGVLPFSLFVRTFCPCRLFYFGTKEATLRIKVRVLKRKTQEAAHAQQVREREEGF